MFQFGTVVARTPFITLPCDKNAKVAALLLPAEPLLGVQCVNDFIEDRIPPAHSALKLPRNQPIGHLDATREAISRSCRPN